MLEAGILPEFIVFVAIIIVQRRWVILSEETKQSFRNRAALLKKVAQDYRKTACRLRGLTPLPTAEIERAETLANEAENNSRRIGALLRKYRKDRDQGIALLASALPDMHKYLGGHKFNCWEALARILATAYEEAGKDSSSITGEGLRKAANRANQAGFHIDKHFPQGVQAI